MSIKKTIFFLFVSMALSFYLNLSFGALPSTLNRSSSAEPETLDPHKMTGVPESNIARDLFEGLIGEDPDGNIIPGVAERWDISPDGLVYTFYLNPHAKWSNGDPLTADDFVYSMRRVLDPLTASAYAQFLYPIKNAQAINTQKLDKEKLGVKALNDRTLQITLENPTPYFLATLRHTTTFPVQEKNIKEWGSTFTHAGHLVSNGAYQLKAWTINASLSLEKNPYYWDKDHVKIDHVNWIPVVDGAAMVRMYLSGQLDVTSMVPTNQYKQLKKTLGDQVKTAPMLATYFYDLNMLKPPFKDNPALRQALSMAIDRDILTQQVLGKGDIPLYAYVPPNTQNITVHNYDWATLPQTEKTAKAKELYAQAGYSKDNPLKLTLLYNTSEDHKKVALAIASMWKQALGIQVELENQEWKVFLNTRREKNYMVARDGWVADYNDATTFLNMFLCQNPQNNSGICDPTFETDMQKAATTVDLAQRQEILSKAHDNILSMYPIIPIYVYSEAYLMKPNVGGFTGKNPLQHIYSKQLYFTDK